MYKVVAIMGEAGSGKDTLLHQLIQNEPRIHEIISFTTRPIREGETNGINYYFITPEEFAEKIVANEMIEASCFNDWFYGTSYENLRSDIINVGVFNPTGVDNLYHSNEVDLTVYYIHATDKTRLLRQLNREKSPDVAEIIRRYGTDKIDFADLDFNYIELTNETANDLAYNVQTILKDLEDDLNQSNNLNFQI